MRGTTDRLGRITGIQDIPTIILMTLPIRTDTLDTGTAGALTGITKNIMVRGLNTVGAVPNAMRDPSTMKAGMTADPKSTIPATEAKAITVDR